MFNPYAGRGRARRHVHAAVAYLSAAGAHVDVAASASADDLTRITAESSRGGYDAVVVVGGDGTLNLAVRDYDFSGVPLGLLPFGSGNDFARVTGLPRTLKHGCDTILGGVTRDVDVALANGRRYLGVAGLGFDTEVSRYANAHPTFLRGSPVYVWAIFQVLPHFRPHRVTIDGRPDEIMFAAVGNSRQYGGGIRIVPDAKIDDGELDACIVHKTTKAQLLMTLPVAYNGGHVRKPFVEMRRGRTFEFESETPLEVYGDGEPITVTPVKFGLDPQKLRFIVPAK